MTRDASRAYPVMEVYYVQDMKSVAFGEYNAGREKLAGCLARIKHSHRVPLVNSVQKLQSISATRQAL